MTLNYWEIAPDAAAIAGDDGPEAAHGFWSPVPHGHGGAARIVGFSIIVISLVALIIIL